MPNHKPKMPSSATLRSTAAPFQLSPSLNHLMIPLQTWLAQNTYSDRLAVGGLIFHPTTNHTRLLILQRANNESAFPNVWEIPGGTCEAADETILHSLAREIREEKHLTLQTILDQVGDVEHLVLKGKWWSKICFLVKVDLGDRGERAQVSLRPEEHQAVRWASRVEVERVLVMTEGQRDIMLRGFDLLELSDNLHLQSDRGLEMESSAFAV
jgi:8-oxo-dGTP pyrophosphatase MutT (NUDIX family)